MSRGADHSRTQILRTLCDGQFHSGEILGQSLGLSRAAVSKHIKALGKLGLDIFSVSGKGYRLASPIQLLAEEQIRATIPGFKAPIEVLNVIDSTNQYLKDKLDGVTNGHTCLAEAQTAGRGRHGRKWVSPYGASLYLSMAWTFSGGYQAIGGLSLAIGVAIANSLNKIGVSDTQLKWPNDVYLQGKKLAGVLIEVEGQMGSSCDCVIGIGVNLGMPEQVEEIDQPWIDVTRATGQSVERNLFAALLINALTEVLEQFEQQGLGPFVEQWQGRDLYKGKSIRLLMGKNEIVGSNRGIDETGALLLEQEGQVKAYYGGEISVRSA